LLPYEVRILQNPKTPKKMSGSPEQDEVSSRNSRIQLFIAAAEELAFRRAAQR
jgi:hypothetical protein